MLIRHTDGVDRCALRAAAREHVDKFNAAIGSGDWTAFAARFAPDAVMRFENVSVGPFAGRDAIEQGYREQPPDDTISVRAVEGVQADTVLVAFVWDSGGSGTMRITWTRGLVSELVIAFG